MFRKTMIAVAAAATLALGVGGAATGAQAGVKIYIGAPVHAYSYQTVGYYIHRHCKWKRVWYNGYWKRVKVCFNHKHYNDNSY